LREGVRVKNYVKLKKKKILHPVFLGVETSSSQGVKGLGKMVATLATELD